jgi:hypothetical protein
MNILYEDEYGVELLVVKDEYPASVGDTVVIAGEEYRVKERMLFVGQNNIIIVVTQNLVKVTQKEVDTSSGRLAEMNNAIVQLNKRQDVSEKKGRALTEQVGGIRRHINQRIQQEKKDTP